MYVWEYMLSPNRTVWFSRFCHNFKMLQYPAWANIILFEILSNFVHFPSFLASFDPEPKLFDQNSDRLGDVYLNVIQYYEIILSSKIDSMHLYLTFSLFLLIFSYFCLENGHKWIRNQNWEGEGVFLRWFQTHDPRGKCIETYFFYLFHP